MIKSDLLKRSGRSAPLRHYLPLLAWLPGYRRQDLVGDLLAGVIVAVMLVPQSMAYALLAGLPPQVGLYASIAPLVLYGIFGTSRSLAVGPVAIVSLLVATGIAPLAEPGSAAYVQLALTLALLVGVIQLAMGLLRIGFVVNFLSHPVLAGFTSAAALIIGASQLKHLLGISIPRTEAFFETMRHTLAGLAGANLPTLAIGAGSIALLAFFKNGLGPLLRRRGVAAGLVVPLTKSGPLLVVLIGTLLVWGLGLDAAAGVRIVGQVPAGLPPLTLPTLDPGAWRLLLPTALTISFVGYMESISVAKSLASKRRQKVDANQELIGLGMANLGATLTGGYPVTGGLSRSVVNFAAGANSGLASMITAVLIALTVLFLTPLFTFLPNAVLAAIILVAVGGLLDLKTLRHVWQYNKADAASMLVTFAAVLLVGIETGILIGVAAAILLFVWRTSKPHAAVVGRLGDSEIYRNVLRHPVTTCPHALVMRIDESLYFANTKYLEETVLCQVADRPEITHFVLVGTAINFIDASALETLESLADTLRDAGVALHLAAIKGPVMDRLQQIGFVAHLGADHFHLTTHDAMRALGCAPSSG
ncbi:MAG: solute carrier family 26 protein [Anaerolineales bacterium]|nr:solute carrier family 26 protein [Anaerolineales bacterium]